MARTTKGQAQNLSLGHCDLDPPPPAPSSHWTLELRSRGFGLSRNVLLAAASPLTTTVGDATWASFSLDRSPLNARAEEVGARQRGTPQSRSSLPQPLRPSPG